MGQIVTWLQIFLEINVDPVSIPTRQISSHPSNAIITELIYFHCSKAKGTQSSMRGDSCVLNVRGNASCLKTTSFLSATSSVV